MSAGSGQKGGPCALLLALAVCLLAQPLKVLESEGLQRRKQKAQHMGSMAKLTGSKSKSHFLASCTTPGKCLLPGGFLVVRMLRPLLEGCCGDNSGKQEGSCTIVAMNSGITFITDEQIYLALPHEVIQKSQPQSCSALGVNTKIKLLDLPR